LTVRFLIKGEKMPGNELIGKEEESQVADVMKRGVLFRYGFEKRRENIFKVAEFEEKFARYIGAKYALAVSSGTAALRVALAALNIEKGDEVITSAFTFIATIEAIAEAGAVPVLAEADSSFNLDPEDLEKKITERTKAVIPVHMFGVSAEMDEIMEIAKKHNLKVIEDNAEACGGSYKGKKLGTIGDIGCFSFDYVKMITTGEGGMVVTDNENLYKEAIYYHDHGHSHKPNTPRGEEGRVHAGFNYRMGELQGAIGIAQLAKLDDMIREQRKHKTHLKERISLIKGMNFRKIPDPNGDISAFLFIYLPDKEKRERFEKVLTEEGVETGVFAYWHYFSNVDPSAYMGKEVRIEMNGQTEDLVNRAVLFPISVRQSEQDLENIVRGIKKASSVI